MTVNKAQMPKKLGVGQWFHYQAYADVELAIELMDELGVRRLRTGISWADFHRPNGKAWYDWQMTAIAEAGYEVLLSIWHTPPSLSEGNSCSSPPRRLADYGDFIEQVIDEYGAHFETLELWNEPNNRLKWDFRDEDPHWEKFGRMIADAAERAHRHGRRTCLGGMIPVDHHWLQLVEGYGALEYVDAVAIHAFPDMWEGCQFNWDWHAHWQGWKDKVDYIRGYSGGRPVWVTETGLATLHRQKARVGRYQLQRQNLIQAAMAPAERLYWYSLMDLAPDRSAIEHTEGDWHDPYEYHLGLTTWKGEPKPAFADFKALMKGAAPEDLLASAADSDAMSESGD